MKVTFLTPYNKHEKVEYYDVLEYVKYIATLPMFKDDFEEFKKHYSYFNAYYDYVMFRLGYIMFNPLLFENMCAIADGTQLYFFHDKNEDYDTIKSHLLDRKSGCYSFMPRITKCDDITLQIEPQTTSIKRDVLVDPNMVSMMSKSTIGPSHVISGNTILNQLLISSKEIFEDYQDFFYNDDSSAVEYLVDKMGFIRLISPEYSPLMVINKRTSTLRQRIFFEIMHQKLGYSFCNSNDPCKSRVPLYRKTLKNIKKGL